MFRSRNKMNQNDLKRKEQIGNEMRWDEMRRNEIQWNETEVCDENGSDEMNSLWTLPSTFRSVLLCSIMLCSVLFCSIMFYYVIICLWVTSQYSAFNYLIIIKYLLTKSFTFRSLPFFASKRCGSISGSYTSYRLISHCPRRW